MGGAWVGVFGYDVVKDVACSWGMSVADVVVVTIFSIRVKDMLGNGIDVVGKLATRECHIHACTVNGLVDDRAGDINGCALGAIDGGRVTELNVLAHIVCREVFDMTFIVGGDNTSIVANISQSQQFTVSHSRGCPGVLVAENAVLAREDSISQTSALAARDSNSLLIVDLAAGNTVGANHSV